MGIPFANLSIGADNVLGDLNPAMVHRVLPLIRVETHSQLAPLATLTAHPLAMQLRLPPTVLQVLAPLTLMVPHKVLQLCR